MQYGAVVVAAGMSTRMGQLKQLMEIEGVSFASRIIAAFKEAGVEDIVMVTGHAADQVEHALAGQGVLFARNDDYKTSQMLDSAKIGFAQIEGTCERVFFCPVDVPLFLPETLKRMMVASEEVVHPTYEGHRGHPILFSAEVIPRILGYDGPGGLKGAFESFGDLCVRDVPVADEGTVMDADTQSDFRKLVNLQRSRTSKAWEGSLRQAPVTACA